jgi:hypothetical protein
VILLAFAYVARQAFGLVAELNAAGEQLVLGSESPHHRS